MTKRAMAYAMLLAVTLLACVAGYLQKLPCRLGGWDAPGAQYAYACYTDLYPLYFVEGLSEGKIPYLDHPVEYPVLMGTVMQIASWLVSAITDPYVAGRAFYDVTVVLLTVAALVAVGATAAAAGNRFRRVVMLATAPGLVLTAFINWDLLAVALTALAVCAWARNRPVAAGVLLGLGIATKFYPVLLLGPLFLLCLRAGRWAAFGRACLAACITWLAVNLPVYLAAPEGWATFYTFSRERGASWGSLWLLFQEHQVPLLGTRNLDTLNTLGSGALLAACGGIAVLALVAPRRPRFAQLAFLTLAAFVLTNKVWSPQFVLWLLPFAVLARPRWPAFLTWQTAFVCYFFAIWYRLLEGVRPGEGVGEGAYLWILALHAAGLLLMCALVVHDILRPEHDLIRAGGEDDPAGGPFDGAPDRRSWTRSAPASPAQLSS